MSLADMNQLLRQFEIYIGLVNSIVSITEPLEIQHAKRVFGVTESADHYYAVQPDAFLYDGSRSNRWWKVDLNIQLKEKLRTRVCQKFSEETRLCGQNLQLSVAPCVPFLVDGMCHSARCKQGHIPKTSENPGLYNARISIHLRQVYLLHLMRTVQSREVWNER